MRLPTSMPRPLAAVAHTCQRKLMDFGYFCMAAALIVILGGVSACGGGGGSSSAAANPVGTSPDTGQLILSITDAAGDFVTYDVMLESMTLTRSNGDVVEALPNSTRIDFTELTDVTELLTVATVPAGVYESVSVRLNFTDAEIVVQDDNGDEQIATPLDADGNLLGVTDMRLQLTTSDVIRITRGTTRAFSLDFDLDASNTIDLTATPPTVTVEPVLLATPELETDRDHRVRGLVESVDTTNNTVNLFVRPFRHRQGEFGQFEFSVNDATVYEVDAVSYTGAAGLQAIADLGARTPLVAGGSIVDAGLLAHTVLAGSSVPWADADVLLGVVSARTGDVLTMQGGRVEFADGGSAYRGEFTINLDADTQVSAPGGDGYDIQSISVGQRIRAWGEFADDVTLNASRVQMRMNQLTAEVVQTQPLAVELYFLNSRRPAVFNFAGTGSSASSDADPDFYEIDTGLLPLNTLDAGDLLRARGLVNDFGQAPADFLARSVIDVQTDARAGSLAIAWPEGSAVPFNAIEPGNIEVNLTEARSKLHLRGVPRDFVETLAAVNLAAPDSGMGVYAVHLRGQGEMRLFRNFADLVDELSAQLDAGQVLHRISAQGQYNVGQATLTTKRAGFVFSSGSNSD